MRGIFLANSVQSFLNAEKYVIISKYYLGKYTLLSNNSHIYSLYDELLDLKNSYYYEKYLMSSVYKRKHCIQRTISFFQILCMQSPPQNDSKVTFMFENNNSGKFM